MNIDTLKTDVQKVRFGKCWTYFVLALKLTEWNACKESIVGRGPDCGTFSKLDCFSSSELTIKPSGILKLC